MIGSRGRAVRRSMRRAIRAGEPDARATFLRSSPGHIASARGVDIEGPRGTALRDRVGTIHVAVLLVLAGAHRLGVRRRATIRWGV
jgi:hypothetical protein